MFLINLYKDKKMYGNKEIKPSWRKYLFYLNYTPQINMTQILEADSLH